jgi:hypothetical protein
MTTGFAHTKSLRGRSIRDRFDEKVDRSGDCWVWLGSLVKGYGQLMVKRRPIRAHRVSWELSNGAIPAGAHVLHHCDNRRCVNPAHLFLGSNLDNIADCKAKGRAKVASKGRPGDLNGRAKLTWEAVRRIRGDSRPTRFVAADYGVNRTTIQSIRSGRKWRVVA